MASKSRQEVLTKAAESIQFTFYSEEEVKASSVTSITSPVLFDNLNRPVPNGLYDPALGPIDYRESCPTCGESGSHCVGHCGHIDLVLPVYNPVFLRSLVKTMKLMCTSCHLFRLPSAKVKYYADKLFLIRNGDIINAKNMESSKEEVIHTSEADVKKHSNINQEYGFSARYRRGWTSFQVSEAKATLDSMMSEIKLQKKCANCDAKLPKISSPVFGRLYQGALSKSDLASNMLKAKKLHTPSAYGGGKWKEHNINIQVSESRAMMDDVINPSEAEAEEVTPKKKSKTRGTDKIFRETKIENTNDRFLTPLEVKDHLKLLWQNEPYTCSLLWEIMQEKSETWNPPASYEMFFVNVLMVPPSRFRPPNKVGTELCEHPQNVLYGKVIQANISLAEALKEQKDEKSLSIVNVTNRWIFLQDAVNALVDSRTANSLKAKSIMGLRQILERKEGLFRQNMMGKRVNHACRSVISPDPYLTVNEIGIPPYFALRLTYPEKVTHWNEEKLRQAVRNGPFIYPGATHYEDEQGIVNLATMSSHQRNAVAKKLLSTPGAASSGGSGETINSTKVEGKTVYRHLQDGDILLVNRQPTLHKPSMMAHVARVLKGEKTLRMHYANCSTYNADFDGDEMNVHFPQDEISRAEAYNIVNANQQFTVPTSGDPIRGLIQDHIVSATLLTKKDTFLTREEYQNLVYTACVSSSSPFYRYAKDCPKVTIEKDESSFVPLPPAIWKPNPLWTGKQVITTILDHITKGTLPFSSKKAGRVPPDYWGKDSGEIEVLIRDNELICGVIDKAQFGKYGLVHIVHELYGADAAGRLLSVFSRLFTAFLQMHGFTCGAVDLLLVPKAENERRKKLEKAKKLGDKVHLQFLGLSGQELGEGQMEEEIEKILRSKGETASARLDRLMSSALNGVTSDVNNSLFPKGLLVPFPKNCLSLMTTTGAKGGMVNFTQISSLLGQQELEGKRVPRMVSGKTLPCFSPWDSSPRAGGFISDRFLTGLRLQEYYFHCMAGRDGLVDTAVKTSRSGYLQRCLIKNLECLTVFYDHTVRDSDGSVVQFIYGEDGVDVTKTSCLTAFEILAANQKLLSHRLHKDKFINFLGGKSSKESSVVLPKALQSEARAFFENLTKKQKLSMKLTKAKEFMDLLQLKYISSLAQPGEAVGVIAGQSIGEPSTQMTLNTFHFAGRGEMNVTLGIPRLREILMMASKELSTPIMTCPLKAGKTREDAERIAGKLRRIRFADLIESMDVQMVPFAVHSGQVQTVYKLRIKVYPPKLYPPYSDITLEKCKLAFDSKFCYLMEKAVGRTLKKLRRDNDKAISVFNESTSLQDSGVLSDDEAEVNVGKDEQSDEEEEDDEMEDDGADAQKRKAQGTDEMDYDDEVEDNERSVVEDISADAHTDEDTDDDNDSNFRDMAMQSENLKNETASKASSTIDTMKSSKKKQNKKRSVSSGSSDRIFEWKIRTKGNNHILLAPIAEKTAKKVYLQSVTNIDRCSVIDFNGDSNTPAVQTDGINFGAVWNLADELDVNRLTTNDINQVLQIYGVDAAYATIVREVRNVFGSYGIEVNHRHLSLIAEFMTFNGGYRPLNRYGISSSTSPFLKISFETATKFLVESCLSGEVDYLESPSSRIVLGQVVNAGTGCFDILQNLEV